LILNKPSGTAVHGGSGLKFGAIEALSRGIRFLMSHTLLGVTEFNGSFSGKQKGMRDASLCYFCLIKSEIKL
ncbi:hypothetical protein ABJY88_14095, partial [Vibrio parahaemolyticus]|uniref:hypothetical protein n=1 Tax=Vibrio parahaemolyticus TaxID=670 RepID=UPI0032AF81E6